VFIGTSNKTDNKKSPFNFKEKVMIMTTMFGIPKNKIVEVKNPYVPTEVLRKFDKDNTAFITVVGKKDASRLGGKFFTPYKDNLDFEGYEDKGYVYIAPSGGGGVSGTEVRNGLKSGSDEDKKKFFTKRAYPKFNQKIFDFIVDKLSKLPEVSENRIFIPKEIVEEWLVQNVNLIKEASQIIGAQEVDDGPNYIFPNFQTFDRVSKKRAEKIGYTVLSQIMSAELTDIDPHPIYPTGPVKAVTPFPAGVAGKTTATNQKDFYGSQAYDKWWNHVTRVAGLLGYSLVDFIELNTDREESLRDLDNEKEEVGNTLKEDIKLPVNVGDTILTGRFKNKKTVVKTIGKDEHGMPTINGRKVVNFRILKEGVGVELNEFGGVRFNAIGYDKSGKEVDMYLPRANNGFVKNIVHSAADKLFKSGKGVEYIEVYYDKHHLGTIKKPKTFTKGKDWNKLPINEIPMADLVKIDTYADKQLNPVDVVLTDKHFFDRLTDPRNKKEITPAELIGFFKRLAKKKKEFINFLNLYGQIVAKDNRSKINIPFMKQANKVIAKTIMRKDDFKTPDPEYKFEQLAKGMDIYDIANMHKVDIDDLDKELQAGIKVEMEHTSDKSVAERIALDHLYEDPNYYTKLKDIEEYVMYRTHIQPPVDKGALGDNPNDEIDEVAPHGYPDQKWLDDHEKELKRLRKKFDKEKVSEGQIDPGEPETGYLPDGKKRKLGKRSGRPEYWFDQLGFTQLDFPKADRMRGKGRGKDKESAFRKVKYTTKNVKVSTLKDSLKPIGSNDWPEVVKEGLIMEGGAYGHMNHPFDTEINLTFGQLKDIVNRALEGNLELTREKTDGQALAVSWRDGRLVAARNKGHLKNKGAGALDINGVAMKFAGRGELEKAYNFAMKDLTQAISKLSEKQRDKIFKGGACFMNLEVIYPTSVNVIPYGQALLVFHGTMEYNEDGIAIGENQDAARILAGMIKQVNADVQSAYTIQGPPVVQLPKSKNLSSLKGKYNGQISKLQSKFKLKDTDGVAEYHQAWWMDFVNKKSPSKLDNKTLMGLVKRWAFYDKSFRLDKKNITDEKTLEWAKGIDKNDHAKMAKDNIRPFEDIFLGVGAEVLSFMSSALTANPNAAVRDMKKRLDKTIKDVQKGGDPKKVSKLKLELERLNAIGGKDKIVPNEGIVFVYGGKTFKLTGTFAPLNQILGLFYE
jgi:hypothetical protein